MEDLENLLKTVVLPESSNTHEQCIYRVPPTLRQNNPKAYTPSVISIGPFHKPRSSDADYKYLLPMEDLKLKYLKGFITRTNRSVAEFVLKFRDLENRIRNCYSEPIDYNSNDFLKMILIDACFIIEHFLRCSDYESAIWEENDPLLLQVRMVTEIVYDLILIENQIPFFILEDIYHVYQENGNPSFLEITFQYFRGFNTQKIVPDDRMPPKHFTDLVRTFMMPSELDSELLKDPKRGEIILRNEIKNVYSASQLRDAGLVFEVSPSKCLLELEFEKSLLKMPCLQVDGKTETILRNIMAFEQCHLPFNSLITQYIDVLDYLINTEKDVEVLVDEKIIVNWMSDTKAVATMFNNLTSDIIEFTSNSKYLRICKGLNKFYENPLNKYKAILKRDYFNTPWKTASTVAALMLVVLTLIQTICSVISLFKGN